MKFEEKETVKEILNIKYGGVIHGGYSFIWKQLG